MTADPLNDAALRERIASLIDDGALPCVLSRDIEAGYGVGRPCAACGKFIESSQVEYTAKTDNGTLNFHLHCHALWQMECEKRRQQSGP